MFKPTRILVPTDMSEHADKAVRQAIEISKQFNAELLLLHVIRDPIQQCVGDYCISQELVDQLQAELQEAARIGIKNQVAKFSALDDISFTADVKTGVPHEEILKEADEKGVELIVISSLGTSGVAKYLIGSVARHVLLGAKCSVLLVR
jgi:nucleotide-binding universal stress UspA family protein